MTDMQGRRAPGWVPDLSTFGARLALVRQAMGWGNVKQAAVLCGIPPETWRTWERDGVEPKSLVSSAMKIADVSGVDYRWLALGPEDRAAEAATTSVGGTLRYRGLGEHVVAISQTDRPTPQVGTGQGMRTRPIDHRLAVGSAR